MDKSIAAAKADPFGLPMQELVTEYCWGEVWGRPGLERKTRSLLNLAMLTALNRPHEVKIHVRGALNNGVTKDEIMEVFLQTAIYCGVPGGMIVIGSSDGSLYAFRGIEAGESTDRGPARRSGRQANMRFMLLTPGTGHFYCGSCLRDHDLGRALRRLGHDVDVVPLYLPLVLEDHADGAPVHMGSINMYLQQKTRLARYLPGWLANLLDNPKLLRWASRRAHMTEAPDLGPMTVSMLMGEHGQQAQEVGKLVDWAQTVERPDIIVLSNAMLSGVVRRLKENIDRPVVATLQGEAPFLDSLPAPFSEHAWQVLTERAADVDAFVPVSHSYGDVMRERLGIAPERFSVVYNGLDLGDLEAEPPPIVARTPKTIGYLARMCRDKGLPTLVAAFLELKHRDRVPGLRLRVAGARLAEDRELVDGLAAQLDERGLSGAVDFLPNVERADKLAFLRTLSVLSVPATYGESFGLYLLEAMATGVPVVQPRHGAFPELLEATGGGVLCAPDDPISLADELETLLLDDSRSQQLATNGRRAVMERFTAERMASEFAEVCTIVVRSRDAARGPSAST